MDEYTTLRDEELLKAALEYHRLPTPGKISIAPTKGLTNQRDLALAYSPGVAYACLAIKDDPKEAASLTSRANLVGVVTNGTAVLGLGHIGPLAAKPVMEGKALPVQEVRRHRRLRHRARRARPGRARRARRRARADPGRRQPRGHQGAGVLLHRGEAARAAQHPGLPRRPARHRDHLGRGGAERHEDRRQAARRHQARVLGRRRRGDRVPRRVRRPRREEAEHLRHRLEGRDLRGPRAEHGAEQGALRAEHEGAQARATSSKARTSSSAARPRACSPRTW